MTEPVSYVIPEDPANPHRLGRKVFHDPRSRAFPFAERPEAGVPVVSRSRWTSTIGILNQARLGSCVPNTGVERVAFSDAVRTGLTSVDFSGTRRALDEPLAVDWYSAVTRLDPFPGGYYPPDWTDTGSDGTSLGEFLKSIGLIDSYTHAFGGLPDVLAALMSGPVPFGTNWYDSMFEPTRDGELVITSGAQVAGGHEFNLDGELDVDRRRVWMTNHWVNSDGTPWGQSGRAWLSYDTLTRLLGENGDATVMHTVPAAAPSPEPAPAADGWFPSDAQKTRLTKSGNRAHPPRTWQEQAAHVIDERYGHRL